MESGPDSFRIEESRFEDGRLPESTAHCSPKNGTPELLSICMKERSYAQPESGKLMTQTKSKAEEYLDISKNQVTGIDNSVEIAPNGVSTVAESAGSELCHSSRLENGTRGIRGSLLERSSLLA